MGDWHLARTNGKHCDALIIASGHAQARVYPDHQELLPMSLEEGYSYAQAEAQPQPQPEPSSCSFL